MQDQAQATRTARGRFRPGHSGNPTGSTMKSKRHREILACVLGDLGVGDLGKLSGIDRIAVEQIVQQLRRAERAKDHAEAARCSRTAQAWLKDVQARRVKREFARDEPVLAEYLAGRDAEAETEGGSE